MYKSVFITIFLLLSACSQTSLQVVEGKTMGTTYRIKVVGKNIDKSLIEKRLSKINRIFSNWDPNSEVSLLNQSQLGTHQLVSDELAKVVKTSKLVYQQTQGFFDPGIGRLIDLWGFGAVKVEQQPTRSEVAKALELSSLRYLKTKGNTVEKTRDIHLNLSAIVKGYALDEIATLLENQGIENFIIEIGGEVKTRGTNRGQKWRVGIEKPTYARPIEITLDNQAIATSGNYRNYLIWEGRHYMHILDPNTGLPATTDLSSVSVIHESAMMADAYATAMMAMGSIGATQLAQKHKLSVVMILDKSNDFKVVKINP